MGHYRVGRLPRTRRWQELINAIGAFSGASKEDISDIANKTLDASSQVLNKLAHDQSIHLCVQFLITLSVSGQSDDVNKSLNQFGIKLAENPSKLQLSKALRLWLEKKHAIEFNPEYVVLTRQATVDTITEWVNQKTHIPQGSLFPQIDLSYEPWRAASDGTGFCELSRTFFSNFTTRYLNYFLSRTASSTIKTISEREGFERGLNKSINDISKHAFETSKLVQSFSAGWFNKYAIGKIPSLSQIEGFVAHSLDKIREELRREKIGGND